MGTPAAPVAAPAAAATPATPSTPATPVAAPVETPAAAPVTPAVDSGAQPAAEPAAAQPTAPAAGAEPKQDDFPGDIESFLQAHSAWERKEQGIEDPTPADAQPAADAQQPADAQPQPGEEEKPWAPEPETSVTPEVLNDFMGKSPEFKAALEASPEIKGALFNMARKNAQLAPLGEIFPNVEAAKYAEQNSNTMVSIRAGFLEAVDNPESFPDAFNRFADEFVIRDNEGKPIPDAEGNVQYDEDFQMMNDHIVDTYHAIEVQDLEQMLQANQFGSEEERENADMALQAFKFIQAWKAGTLHGEKPDLSGLAPDVRAYYEGKEREFAEREAKLTDGQNKQSAAQRNEQRQTFETQVTRKIGSTIGARIDQMLKEKGDAGVFLPSYVTDAKVPGTNISLFAKTLLDKFQERTYGRVDQATGKVIGGVSFLRNQAKMLAMRPPSPEAEQARIEFATRLIDEYFPAVFNEELRSIQRKEMDARKARLGKVEARQTATEPEPRAGSQPTPRNMDAQSAMQEAYKLVDEKYPDLDPRERTEKALVEKNRLMGVRY